MKPVPAVCCPIMAGDELRKRREALGMTQEQLAGELGVAANTVARWERGERSIPPHLSLALKSIEQDHGQASKRAGKR